MRESKVIRTVTVILCMVLVLLPTTALASSGDIGSSKIGTGLQKLISDVTNWLMILAVPFAGLVLIYLFIRKSMADEMDAKKYNQRITTTLVCFVAIEVASILINILQGYFG